MKNHSEVKRMLYEYLVRELSDAERSEIEGHLRTCRTCTDELAGMETALKGLDALGGPPSEKLPASYWNSFSQRVENRLNLAAARPSRGWSWRDAVETFLVVRRPFALAGSIAVVIIAVGLWKLSNDRASAPETLSAVQNSVSSDSVRDEMSRYFRRSKTLLIGITNMKLPEDEQVDLTAERRTSQELIHQARYLQSQLIDQRSARLIEDLNRILIELANMKEENNMPNVQIVRAGIHNENLLFKIRMAETIYDTTKFIRARNDF